MDFKKLEKCNHHPKTKHKAGKVKNMHQEDIIDAVQTLAKLPFPSGNRVAVMGPVFGSGGECADHVESTIFHPTQLRLAKFSMATMKKIVVAAPEAFFFQNPVDLSSSTDNKTYAKILKILLDAPEVDMLLCQDPFDGDFPATEEPKVKEALADEIAALVKSSVKPVLFINNPEKVFPGTRKDAIVGFPTIPRVITAAQFLIDFKNTLEIKMLESQFSSAISFS